MTDRTPVDKLVISPEVHSSTISSLMAWATLLMNLFVIVLLAVKVVVVEVVVMVEVIVEVVVVGMSVGMSVGTSRSNASGSNPDFSNSLGLGTLWRLEATMREAKMRERGNSILNDN